LHSLARWPTDGTIMGGGLVTGLHLVQTGPERDNQEQF
jgi:hypothetical protein